MATDIVREEGRCYGKWDPSEHGTTLTWRDVSVYTIVKETVGFCRRTKPTYKRIVNNVTGAVKPGSLVALMGGSGAGKSTLMAALAYRNPVGVVVDGDIRVNGRPLGDYMHRLSGFMHQQDLFVSSLTVQEHLNFMARLKLDRRTSILERQGIVSDLLVQLGLNDNASTLIGATGQDKVLSGGERKRLSFATEEMQHFSITKIEASKWEKEELWTVKLLTDPPLLFCDEPTTGLDSFSAHKLVEKMKQMAYQGRTILCTIHQPSSDVFNMFHELILIADGRIAFTGDTKTALEFFSNHGYDCPEKHSPADFFIRTLAMTPGSEDASRQAVKRLCDEFVVSDTAREVELTVQFQEHVGSTYEHFGDVREQNFKAPFWCDKLQLLTHRYFLHVLRDPSIQFLKILQKITIAVMVGLCYAGTVRETQAGVQSVQGALFIFVTENTFTPMYSVLALFPLELPLFMREYRNGLYSTHIYYLSKMAAMLPGLIVDPLLFVLVAYWLTGLRGTLYAFLMTVFITTLTVNVATACGCFFSNAFDSVSIAMAYLVPFDYVLMVTSGLFIKLSTLPYYVSWTKNLSWLMYSNEAMSVVQWADVGNITCEMQSPDLPCLKDGSEVLDRYSFSTENLWRDVIAMATLCFLFHLLGYLCLSSRVRNS